MTTKTENVLLDLSVPLFLLAGMDKHGDDLHAATVVSHTNKELKLDVSGSEVKAKVSATENHYKDGTRLVFNKDGKLVDVATQGQVFKKAEKAKGTTASSPSKTGSTDLRKNKLF